MSVLSALLAGSQLDLSGCIGSVGNISDVCTVGRRVSKAYIGSVVSVGIFGNICVVSNDCSGSVRPIPVVSVVSAMSAMSAMLVFIKSHSAYK